LCDIGARLADGDGAMLFKSGQPEGSLMSPPAIPCASISQSTRNPRILRERCADPRHGRELPMLRPVPAGSGRIVNEQRGAASSSPLSLVRVPFQPACAMNARSFASRRRSRWDAQARSNVSRAERTRGGREARHAGSGVSVDPPYVWATVPRIVSRHRGTQRNAAESSGTTDLPFDVKVPVFRPNKRLATVSSRGFDSRRLHPLVLVLS
jgi:hypothetical protein